MDILIKLHNIHLLGEELGVLSCEFLVDLDSLEEARSRARGISKLNWQSQLGSRSWGLQSLN